MRKHSAISQETAWKFNQLIKFYLLAVTQIFLLNTRSTFCDRDKFDFAICYHVGINRKIELMFYSRIDELWLKNWEEVFIGTLGDWKDRNFVTLFWIEISHFEVEKIIFLFRFNFYWTEPKLTFYQKYKTSRNFESNSMHSIHPNHVKLSMIYFQPRYTHRKQFSSRSSGACKNRKSFWQ